MNAHNEREVARQLADMPSVEPPAELLARIKADIPEELPVPGTRAPGGESNVLPFRLPRTWLAAAAVVVMLAGGGLLTWRLTEVVDSPRTALEMSDAAVPQEAARQAAAADAAAPEAAEAQDESVRNEAETEAAQPFANGLGFESSASNAEQEPAVADLRIRVRDESGGTLPGVVIEATGAVGKRTAVTDADGEAKLELPAGEYDVLGSLDGFATLEVQDVEMEGGEKNLAFELSMAFADEVAVRTGEDTEIDDMVAFDVVAAPPPPPPQPSARSIPKPQAVAPAGPTPEELNRAVAERRRKAVPVPDPTPVEPEAGLEGYGKEVTVSGSAPVIDTTSTTGGATFREGDVPTRSSSDRFARRDRPQAKAEPEPDVARQLEEPAEEKEVETGGLTAEHGFRDWGVSPFVDSSEDRLSTFGLDVDTGAYTVLRRYLDDGRLPPPAAVRVEEIVNWFTYSDPFAERPARAGETFRVVADGAPSPVGPGPGHRLLRFQVAARPVAKADRKPAVITLVVDNSGSMEGENLELVRAGLRRLVENLNPGDLVALVGFSDDAWVVASHGDRKALANGIEAMKATDGTNAEAGLKLGYRLAEENFRDGCSNRVILLSDGVANVGATGPEAILARIGKAANRGIELTTVGVGMNYNDEMLEQLADRGDGRYAYVDRPEESERLFVEELTGTLETLAEEARVQVEFDPRAVVRWRLLGYENRDIADERFRHDHSVDAGEVGAGQQVTALYEVELVADGVTAERPLAEIKLRWREPFGGEFQESSQRLLAGDLAATWGGASRDLRLAAVAAELAEVLRDSPHARGMGLRQLVGPAKAVAAEFPGDGKVAELATLIEKAAAVK